MGVVNKGVYGPRHDSARSRPTQFGARLPQLAGQGEADTANSVVPLGNINGVGFEMPVAHHPFRLNDSELPLLYGVQGPAAVGAVCTYTPSPAPTLLLGATPGAVTLTSVLFLS